MAEGSWRRSRRCRIVCSAKWLSASRSVTSRPPGVEMAIVTGTFMSPVTNMPSTSASRFFAPSGKSGRPCWMPTSVRRTASFIPWAAWRYRRITPSWRWPKITSPDGSMVCVSAIWRAGTGIRRCSITFPPTLSGPTTLKPSTTSKSTPRPCILIRSGGIRSALHREVMNWFMRRKTRPFTSACIKPPPNTM